jgi:TonB family protein
MRDAQLASTGPSVTDILSERSREADGLTRMVLYSLGAHLVLIAALALMPGSWFGAQQEPERMVMSISLGGSPGPDTGGRNQIAGKAVQEVGEEVKQPFALPPAPKPPEMVMPSPKPAPTPKSKVEKPAPPSPSRKTTKGAEVKPGERIDTGGAAVPFGGLSSSGGKGLNAQTLGLENFCCPEYLETMLQLIRRNWNQNQGAAGTAVVKFVIRRDGALTQVEVAKPSNNVILDLESRRAVYQTGRVPPLPPQYTGQNLTIHLTFEYQR